MLDLKQHFEKIYLISCYHTKDRLDVTLPHLRENGIDSTEQLWIYYINGGTLQLSFQDYLLFKIEEI